MVAALGFLEPLPLPTKVWEDLPTDFIKGLLMSQGRNVIMIVVDRYSKFAYFIPLHRFIASKVARVFFKEFFIFRLYGLPKSIVFDRDKVLTGSFWQELFKIQITQLYLSSTYHPQSDGQTKRINQCLE